MKKLLLLVPIPVLVAGLAFAARRPGALSRPATETADAYAKSLKPASAASDLRYRFNTHQSLLYRFDSTGEVEVAPPADSKKAPAKGQFHLTGVLAVRAVAVHDDGAEVEFQFRDCEKLQGQTAVAKMDARGQIHSIEGDAGVAVFLRNFEVVLPPLAGETSWEVSGRDPVGEYTARYLLGGWFAGPVARFSIVRRYSAGGREYKTVAHFDAARGCATTIDVTGAVNSNGAVTIAGATRLTFALADVVEEKLAPQPRVEKPAKPVEVKKRPEPRKENFDELATTLRSSDKMQRQSAALRLAAVRTPEARALAIEALKDHEFIVRASAAVALGSWKDDETAQLLAGAVRSDAADVVRMRAAGALQGTVNPEARQALADAATNDRSAYVRQIASESLVVKGIVK